MTPQQAVRAMELAADPGLTLLVHTAEPGSRPADALLLLASWAVTLDAAEPLTSDTTRQGRP